MRIAAIVGVGHNNVIGKNNDMPWHLPADLKYFKRTTLGHHIIMGRKNYEAIGRPLPKRTNVIITHNTDYTAEGCTVVNSITSALELAKENGDSEAFIIGGGQIYWLSIPMLDRLYITEIDVEVPDGDVFFPEIDFSEWKLVSSEAHSKDEKNKYDYTFKVYDRI
ncbi:MAG: dihydrofolate reductase [Aureispira sp.]|nr:dihydrofolate reductase [Aureispira sp.]